MRQTTHVSLVPGTRWTEAPVNRFGLATRSLPPVSGAKRTEAPGIPRIVSGRREKSGLCWASDGSNIQTHRELFWVGYEMPPTSVGCQTDRSSGHTMNCFRQTREVWPLLGARRTVAPGTPRSLPPVSGAGQTEGPRIPLSEWSKATR